MAIWRWILCAFVLIGAMSCSKKVTSPFDYLALGDSYTIGESVPESMRWPVQLAEQLRAQGILVHDPNIVATTGWTTEELMTGIARANVTGNYDLVSLLIGVNDQYRSYPFHSYEPNFEMLLKSAIGFAGGNIDHVFVLSIPDYGVTPFGQKSDPARIAQELDAYNAVAKTICEKYGIQFFNITEISRDALNDNSLIAEDQLHPSGKMYTLWVNSIVAAIKSKLQ